MTREELIKRIQEEMSKRNLASSNKPKITTREQAEARALEVENENKDDVINQFIMEALNPVDLAVTSGLNALKAAGSAVRAPYNATAGKLLGKAKAQQNAINLVKEGSELAPYAKNKIMQAAGALDVGAPGQASDIALRELIKGKSGKINPDIVSDVFPNYAKKLAQKRGTETIMDAFGSPIEVAKQAGQVDVPLNRLLKLKRAADKAAGFSKNQAPFSEKAVSKVANARMLGDAARTQLYQNAPGSEEVLSNMGQNIKLKNFLTKGAESNPVGLLKAKEASTKDSVLASVAKKTGVDLRNEGNLIESASDLLLDPVRLTRPLEAPKEALYRYPARAAASIGSGIAKAADAVSPIINEPQIPELVGLGAIKQSTASSLNNSPQPNATQQSTQPNREQLIQQIQQELKRRGM